MNSKQQLCSDLDKALEAASLPYSVGYPAADMSENDEIVIVEHPDPAEGNMGGIRFRIHRDGLSHVAVVEYDVEDIEEKGDVAEADEWYYDDEVDRGYFPSFEAAVAELLPLIKTRLNRQGRGPTTGDELPL